MYEARSVISAVIFGGRSGYFRLFLSWWARAVPGGFRGGLCRRGVGPIPLGRVSHGHRMRGAVVAPLVRVPNGLLQKNRGAANFVTVRPFHAPLALRCSTPLSLPLPSLFI